MPYKWKIEVLVPKNRFHEGKLIFTAYRYMSAIYKFNLKCDCRAQGNYTQRPKSIAWNKKNGDTPTGKSKCYTIRKSDNEKVYGPNKRIDISSKALSGNMLKAVEKYQRSGMQIHGGRDSGEASNLWNTSGCIRVHDKDIKKITEYIDKYCVREGVITIIEK